MKSQMLSLSGFLRLPWIAWALPQAIETDMGAPTLAGVLASLELAATPTPRSSTRPARTLPTASGLTIIRRPEARPTSPVPAQLRPRRARRRQLFGLGRRRAVGAALDVARLRVARSVLGFVARGAVLALSERVDEDDDELSDDDAAFSRWRFLVP